MVLFCDSVEKSLSRGNCPGFIVASSEEGLREQHPSLNPIHTLIIQPDEMKSVTLTENMHFSYSSARDAYTEYDPEISPNKSITHNWQSYVAGCDIQRQSMVEFNYRPIRRQHIAFLRVDRDASGDISWKFES